MPATHATGGFHITNLIWVLINMNVLKWIYILPNVTDPNMIEILGSKIYSK